MTELIKINLLPYREEIKQRKRQQFKILMLSSLLIGVGLSDNGKASSFIRGIPRELNRRAVGYDR